MKYIVLYHPGYQDEKRVFAMFAYGDSPESALRDALRDAPAITPLAIGHLGAPLYAVKANTPRPQYRVTANTFQQPSP